MMKTSERPVTLLAAFAACAALSCAATSEKSTGTNWLKCTTNDDCAVVEGTTCGAQHVCVDGSGRPISKTLVARHADAGTTSEASWARTPRSPTAGSLYASVTADRSGNAYAAGNLWGPSTLDFANGVTAVAKFSGYNGLLLEYDGSGMAQWAEAVGTDSVGADFASVAVDSSNNLYAAGYVSGGPGVLDLGNGVTITKSETFHDALLVQYDTSGNARWAKIVSDGSSNSTFNSVVVDASGNVLVAGELDGTGTYGFGDGVMATGTAMSDTSINIAANPVVAKYDSSGRAQWARTVISGSPGSSFASLALDSEGNTYAAGSIGGTGTYDFGDGVAITGVQSRGHIGGQAVGNAALVKYDSSGRSRWARTLTTSPGGSGFSSVAVDSSGSVYAAGSIGDVPGPAEGPYDFGNGVTAAGTVKGGGFTGLAGALFLSLVKYDSSGTAQWARTVSPGGSNSYFLSVAVDTSGNVYAGGAVHSTGTYVFGNGATIATGTNDTGYYVALVKYDSFGRAKWARSSTVIGSTENVFASVTLDAAGTLYAAGYLGEPGVVDFGNGVTATGTHVSAGNGWSPLLVKY